MNELKDAKDDLDMSVQIAGTVRHQVAVRDDTIAQLYYEIEQLKTSADANSGSMIMCSEKSMCLKNSALKYSVRISSLIIIPITMTECPTDIDSRAAILAIQIVEGHYENAGGSHMHWLYRQCATQMHRDFMLSAREEALAAGSARGMGSYGPGPKRRPRRGNRTTQNSVHTVDITNGNTGRPDHDLSDVHGGPGEVETEPPGDSSDS